MFDNSTCMKSFWEEFQLALRDSASSSVSSSILKDPPAVILQFWIIFLGCFLLDWERICLLIVMLIAAGFLTRIVRLFLSSVSSVFIVFVLDVCKFWTIFLDISETFDDLCPLAAWRYRISHALPYQKTPQASHLISKHYCRYFSSFQLLDP